MQTLKATQYFSGTLPSGETVTLFTGNERAFEETDAQWLLSEYPDRFLVDVTGFTIKASADADVPNSVSEPEPAGEVTVTGADPVNDPSLIRKPAPEVPGDIEKFGATTRRGKSKKG